MCAVKPRLPKEKLASVATGSGKHTSAYSNERPEQSRTKRTRMREEKLKWGKTQIKRQRGVEVLCIMSCWNVSIAELI